MSQQALWSELDYTTGRGSVDHLERYYTPDALARFCVNLLPWRHRMSVLEPHAGGGAFLRALERLEWRPQIGALDIDETSWAVQRRGATVRDFLAPLGPDAGRNCERVIGNPPFSNAEVHVEQGLRVAPEVAFLLPVSRLDAQERCGWWQRAPLRHTWLLARRVWPGSRQIGFFWFDRNHDGPATIEVVDQGAA